MCCWQLQALHMQVAVPETESIGPLPVEQCLLTPKEAAIPAITAI